MFSRIFYIFLFSLGILMCTGKITRAQDVVVSYQTFYDDLSPYGQWVDDPQYGYVWVPDAGDDFRPYFSGGHWIMTNYGNTWVSEYPWGWACFHYGRWIYNDYYGWVWIPGYEWGPGWVVWRWGNGYCGWAPMYPGYMWGAGIAFGCPDDWWIFLHPTHLYRPRYVNIWRLDFMRGPHHTHHMLTQTSIVTQTYPGDNMSYHGGPRPQDVEQVTHHPVQVFNVHSTTTRGETTVSNNTVNIYKPDRLAPGDRNTIHPDPKNVVTAPRAITKPEEVKKNWGRQREFKQMVNQQNPTRFSQPYTRNEPPYSDGTRQHNAPAGNGTRTNGGHTNQPTHTQQPARTPSAPRPAPTPRQQAPGKRR